MFMACNQEWGGGQKRQTSLALSKLVTLFSLPFLYIGQGIFLNCFLLEANDSRCAQEFTERERESEREGDRDRDIAVASLPGI